MSIFNGIKKASIKKTVVMTVIIFSSAIALLVSVLSFGISAGYLRRSQRQSSYISLQLLGNEINTDLERITSCLDTIRFSAPVDNYLLRAKDFRGKMTPEFRQLSLDTWSSVNNSYNSNACHELIKRLIISTNDGSRYLQISKNPNESVPDFSKRIMSIEDFDYLWLIWGFSENVIDMTAEKPKWFPTVRPPRLGGKVRKGVWATRSPYRPNSLAISSVKLIRVETDPELALIVSGGDMVNGSPVYDIKPYLPYADSHPEAGGGFTEETEFRLLDVDFPEELLELIPEDRRDGLLQVLRSDPRGAYEKQPGYSYGMSFSEWDIKFTVEDGILKVTDVVQADSRTGRNSPLARDRSQR